MRSTNRRRTLTKIKSPTVGSKVHEFYTKVIQGEGKQRLGSVARSPERNQNSVRCTGNSVILQTLEFSLICK